MRLNSIVAAVAGMAAAVLLAVPAGAVSRPDAPGGDQFVLPAPTGPYPVGWEALHVVDPDRPDPWAPPAPRELMVSVWYPAAAARGPHVPYATAEESRLMLESVGLTTVPSDSLTRVQTHARIGTPPLPGRHRLPLVVLSPGLTDPRWMQTTLAEDLASRGYLVVAVDHPYEGAVVTLPGGRVVQSLMATLDPDGADIVASRVRDLSLVLDRVLAHPRYGRMADPDRVAVVGHSMGGATAAATLLADPRVDAGINLDGTFHHPPDRDLTRPFLMLGADPHPRPHQPGQDPTWDRTWPHLTTWGRWLYIPQMVHRSPSDVAVVGEWLGLAIQPLPGARCVEITRTYVAAFLDQHLRQRHQPLLDGPSPHFPEVQFVGATG